MPAIIVNWKAGYEYGGVSLNEGENIVAQEVVDMFEANEQIRREIAHGKLEVVPDAPKAQKSEPEAQVRTEAIGDITPPDKESTKPAKKGKGAK